MAEEMERLKNLRTPKRRQATRLANMIINELGSFDPDLIELQTNVVALRELQGQLDELDSKIAVQCIVDKWSDADQDKELDEAMDIKRRYLTMKARVESLSDGPSSQMVTNGSSSGTAPENRQRSFKLPKIELKKFSGELTDWIGFWAQFEKIDLDDTLHATDKFQYLHQAMKEGSDAHQIVSSYPHSADNYPKVIESLKKRFGNEDLLLQVYIRELLNLVICNVNSKEKIPFEKLYIKLESHLRALKSLNLENADPASWLFPLVESSLPEEILLAWERSSLSSKDGSQYDPPKTRLDFMMDFLNQEVDIRQKINLAKNGFQHDAREQKSTSKSNVNKDKVPTLSGMHIGDSRPPCVFCDKPHASQECFTAQRWSLEQKRSRIKEKKCCFNCFSSKHMSKDCKSSVKCCVCDKKHHTLMCPSLEDIKKNSDQSKSSEGAKPLDKEPENISGMSNHVLSSRVALNTLMVTLCNGNKKKRVRAFIDSGSQRTYVLKSTADELQLSPISKEEVRHSIFGGLQTPAVTQLKYNVIMERPGGSYRCRVDVRDQQKICGLVPRISRNTPALFNQLKENKIYVTDVGEDCPPIELLIGADIYGRLLTGKVVVLESGVTAIETKLGWTLSGEISGPFEENQMSMSVMSLAVSEISVSQMWDLDVLGIRDAAELKTEEAQAQEAREELLRTITRNEDGRYVVALPWKEGHPELPTNREVAMKRLNGAIKKLEAKGLVKKYDNIFHEWELEGFIERVPNQDLNQRAHYLPHRPVLKPESITTPVRPVFDGSCKVGKNLSLNDCLEKGVNYVKLIPEVLLRFREKKIGFVSDIRKAFQMIEVKHQDRDVMRFLWFENGDPSRVVEFRHVRVMFGATCSPFILGAVLQHHLSNVEENYKKVAEKLMDSLYVDNCVSSVNTIDEYEIFKMTSVQLLEDAKMELRMWMCNNMPIEDPATTVVPVLGLKWNRTEDHLYVDVPRMQIDEAVTKRTVLSAVHKIFDPVGFTSPSLIPMKTLLQNTWVDKLKWDEDLPDDQKSQFMKWLAEVGELEKIHIPRMVTHGVTDHAKYTLHTFTDASQIAYAAAVFLRVETSDGPMVQLLSSKSRIAPLKNLKINRLELMGCLIGSRLAASVKSAMNLDNVPEFYWSDSSTVLTWIKRNEKWSTFVGNRIQEITSLTSPDDWRHVPGHMNPADLPSRGCFPARLLQSTWWEGPLWLKAQPEDWPTVTEKVDEDAVNLEKKKVPVLSTTMTILESTRNDHTYAQNVRIMAWVLRFAGKFRRLDVETGPLTIDELRKAEIKVLREIQNDAFSDPCGVIGVDVYKDEDGLLRVKTRLVQRDDVVDFKFPILLPRKHPLVEKLITEAHRNYCHAGVGFLICKLRERYWILQARSAIKKIVNSCNRCRRYSSKKVVTEIAPLPLDRIKDAQVFQVVGVDLAGPLILKNGAKAWIAIFTCGVFRAIHLELLTSLSTRAFIKALQRFVRIYGRPEIIFSDNGTNFRGAYNLFKKLDWNQIQKEESVQSIKWRFNPPSAAWWGGWWERLIRSIKDLMRRMLGKATLNKEELERVLTSVEQVMNGRPLTYVSPDPEDLEPLTPAMFLRPVASAKFPESVLTEGDKLRIRYKCVETVRKELHDRFRIEYLSQLISKQKEKPTRPVRVGELVFVENDQKKRMEWPLGRILQLIPGKDGVCRVAVVKTQDNVLTRPVQRLFPLEVQDHIEGESLVSVVKTKSGRIVKVPSRLQM